MTNPPPRSAAQALAQAMGVSEDQARRTMARLPHSEEAQTLDAQLRANSALADLEAARLLDDVDIADAASEADPAASVRDIVAERSDRILTAQIAAHTSWARTEDRAARTQRGREAFDARFEREVDPDGVLEPAERARRAAHARKAYFLRLALKSAKARRRGKS